MFDDSHTGGFLPHEMSLLNSAWAALEGEYPALDEEAMGLALRRAWFATGPVRRASGKLEVVARRFLDAADLAISLRAAGALLYGSGWRAPLARALNVDARTLDAWAWDVRVPADTLAVRRRLRQLCAVQLSGLGGVVSQLERALGPRALTA